MTTMEVQGAGDLVELTTVVEDGQCYYIDVAQCDESGANTIVLRRFGDEICHGGDAVFHYLPPDPDHDPLGDGHGHLGDGHLIPTPQDEEEQVLAVRHLLQLKHQENQDLPSNSINDDDGSESPVLDNGHSPIQFVTGDVNVVMGGPLSMMMTEDTQFPKVESTPRPRVVKSYGKKSIVKPQNDQGIKVIPTTIGVKDCITNRVPQPIKSKAQPHSRRYVVNGVTTKRLAIDIVKSIPTQEFKNQLSSTLDITQAFVEYAPPTKEAMNYMSYEGVGKYFANPGRNVVSVPLSKLFLKRLHLMVTESRRGSKLVAKKIEPLDSELRTPESVDDNVKFKRFIPHFQLHDTLAKRMASSFDSYCKGMMRPPKYEYIAKESKHTSHKSSKLSQRFRNRIKTTTTAALEETTPKILSFNDNTDCTESLQLPTFEGDISNPEEVSNIVYTIEENSVLIKSEESPFSNGIVEESEIVESATTPSNIEMLIAAAEHENSLIPNESVNNEISIKDEGLTAEEKSCDTGMEVEPFIVLGENGERYRVTSSIQGQLSFWPDTDTNIFS